MSGPVGILRDFLTSLIWMILFCIMATVLNDQSVDDVADNVTSKPNIVLVIVDDLGYHDVGYNGGDYPTTTIDSLAQEGVILDRYYTNTLCTPSRSELLTGRYTIHTSLQQGNIQNAQPLGIPLDIPLLSEQLQAADYNTHHVGKWHLGFFKREYTPTARGYDTFYGFYTGEQGYFDHVAGGGATGWTYGSDWWGYDWRDGSQTEWNNTDYSTNIFTHKATNIIERHAQDNTSKPLFLTLAYQALHGHVEAPKECVAMFDYMKDESRQIYAAGVYLLDEGMKNVTQTLKATGLWENTVFILISDNGGDPVYNPARNFPFRGGKGTLWEGALRVPSFVTSPLLQRSGYRNTALIHVTDWMPTLLHLAEVTIEDEQLDGFNIWQTISNDVGTTRTEILHVINPFAELSGENMFPEIYNTQIKSSLLQGQWKILTGDVGDGTLYLPFTPHQDTNHSMEDNFVEFPVTNISVYLFNLHEDPYERYNVAHQHPEVVIRLLELLAWYNSTSLTPWHPDPDVYADPVYYNNSWVSWQDSEYDWVREEYQMEQKE